MLRRGPPRPWRWSTPTPYLPHPARLWQISPHPNASGILSLASGGHLSPSHVLQSTQPRHRRCVRLGANEQNVPPASGQHDGSLAMSPKNINRMHPAQAHNYREGGYAGRIFWCSTLSIANTLLSNCTWSGIPAILFLFQKRHTRKPS